MVVPELYVAKAQGTQGTERFEPGFCALSQVNNDDEGRRATLIGSDQRRLTSESKVGYSPSNFWAVIEQEGVR